jgi:hypothetical protein
LDVKPSDKILVHVVPVVSGREIGWNEGFTERLRDRLDDVRSAVAEGARAIILSLPDVVPGDGWEMDELSASFGVCLAAEGGAILTKVSGEATFEVTVTYRRTS